MTTQEKLSQNDIDVGFDEIVTELLGEKTIVSDDEHEVQTDWEKSPGERIRAQLEILAVLYADRCDAFTLDLYGVRDDIVSFATRSNDGSSVNEVYSVVDSFNNNNHEQYRHSREHVVDMYSEDGDQQRIHVLADGTVEVSRVEHGEKRVVDDEETCADILFDYRHRIFNIVEATRDRGPDERVESDEQARIMLQTRRYGSPKVIAAID